MCAHLVAGTGSGEKDAGALARKGRGGAGLAQVAEGGDLSLHEALLAEAGLGVGDGQDNDGKLAGRHFRGVFIASADEVKQEARIERNRLAV